ncbi:methyl-viologen-reducing hydrogenase subunit delta [candidate division MSBL1 archaeon SCGC-AAA261F17]|uniref:Methyl-viologen-reducing hydrogenase subunit delta n=1 Tax=candidate division MSBL1 archaeon SCGC-AAA261F17 TaxID=1698274 RepID=A0A133V4F5_9EURY|nr:methyl-viologen-reducing hydrogenase subunit delta [candidate division MSBL1 archaeon SCGC-AAA261F17]
MGGFKPKIVGLLCRWCTYQAADTAGTSRMKYPPNLIPVRVQCSGRIDPTFVIKAFESGADGVFIGGCHPGDCHYEDGNYNTMRRIPILKRLLGQFGIEEDRLRLEWISAAEPNKFVKTVTEFTERIYELGPLEWEKVKL